MHSVYVSRTPSILPTNLVLIFILAFVPRPHRLSSCMKRCTDMHGTKPLDHSEVVAEKVASWVNELYAS